MDSRIYHFVIKEFRQLVRDPRMLIIALIIPIVQLLLFGYIASTDIKNIPTVVQDDDRTSISRDYLQRVKNSGYFDLNYYVQSNDEYTSLMNDGKVAIVIHIPKDFKKDILAGKSTNVQAIIDGSNSFNATIILGYIEQINFNYSNAVLMYRLNRAGLAGNAVSPFDMVTRVWYNPELKSIYFMVPAVFALILFVICFVLTMFSVVKEREKGTVEQLMITPLRPLELLLGKIIPPMLVSFADIIFVFLVVVLWFRIPVRGSVPLFFLLAILFSGAGLGIGLLISTISRNQRQAIMTVVLVQIPSIVLSGFIFPIASMPLLIQWLTYLIPLRYFLIIVREIFLKGTGIRYLWSEVWPMMVFVVTVLGLSVAMFRNKIE